MLYKSIIIDANAFEIDLDGRGSPVGNGPDIITKSFSAQKLASGLADAPTLDTHLAYRSAYRAVFKRVVDILLVGLMAPIIAFVVAVMATLVALDGGNPFYFQQRVGLNGRIFRMWKVRSMVVDADARFESYLSANPEAKREWDVNQKLAHDPRITRIGRLLRKTSLDELPQMWNVLNGSMSLVGPRPMMPSQQALYPGQAYYRLLPGITGPWQVSARNKSTFADRANYDQGYEQTLSFKTDIGLLIKTVSVVLHGTGC